MLNKWQQSIVDRLRYATHNNQTVTLGANEVHIPLNAMEENDQQKDEIDALKGTLDTVGGMARDAVSEVAALKAENERLKAALSGLITVVEVEADFHDTTGYVITRDNLRGLAQAARAALEGGQQ